MKKLLLFTLTIFLGQLVYSQCPFPTDNFQNFTTYDLTPTVQGPSGTQTSYDTWGGDYHKVEVVAGEQYEISTCRSGPYMGPADQVPNPGWSGTWPFGPAAGQEGYNRNWDPQMTLIDSATSTIVGFNDNFCGDLPAMTYTATFTGTMYVLFDSATVCDQFEVDSIVVDVTWLFGCSNTTSSFSVTECVSYTVPSGDETYTAVGTYTVMDTIPNAESCDSIMTISVTIPPPLTGNVTDTICNNDSMVVNGTTYNFSNPSGTEVFTNIGPNNCDSTVTVNLSFNPTYDLTETIAVHHGDTVTFPDSSTQVITTDSVTHTSSLSTTNGCDSIINTMVLLTPGAPPNGTCDGVLNFDGSNDYVNVGTFTHSNNQFTVEFWANIPNTSSPWDHIVENGSVEYNFSSAYRIEVGSEGEVYCALGNGSVYNDGGYSSGYNLGWQYGEWNHYALTYDGNTAKVYLNGVERISFTTGSLDITQGDGTLLFSSYQQGSRFYDGMLDEVRIWDAVKTSSDLVTGMSTQLTGAESNLLGYWDFNDRSGSTLSDITTAGNNGTLTNMDTLMDWNASNGDTFHLRDTLSICNNDSVVVGTNTYTATGVYTDVLTTGGGCDSIVVTDLTVAPAIDVTITNTSPTLTANQSGATYQWVDCDNGNSPIASETGQSFTATANGNYAVEITVGACTETSACENVTGVGIKENIQNTVSIYPNPTTGIFTINLGNNANTINYSISSIDGRIIEQGKTFQNIITIDLNDQSKGIYFLRLNTGNDSQVFKIMKQ